MKREAIVGEDNNEEDQVDKQVQHVRDELQVEHIHPLQPS